jgi:cytochrome c-type biogenesis protein CcmH
MHSRSASLLLAATLWVLPGAALADEAPHSHAATEAGEDLQEYVEGANRLEGRIMAPCCWNQTIDIHGSEPAYELRREIRRRLKGGESADAIEASLVQRYGQKILAVPDSSPLGSLATLLALGFGAAGVSAYFMLKRWSRVGAANKAEKRDETKSSAAPKKDSLDERLDRELAEIENQA